MSEKSPLNPLTQEARRYLLAKRELEKIEAAHAIANEADKPQLKIQYDAQSAVVHNFSPAAINHAIMLESAMQLIDSLEANTDTPETIDELNTRGDIAADVVHRITTGQEDADPGQLQRDNEQLPDRQGMFDNGDEV